MKLRYRPDPARSVIEDLYSSEENPSPVLSLLEELYAIHAIGVTKFWVKDEKEISSMKLALRVCISLNIVPRLSYFKVINIKSIFMK